MPVLSDIRLTLLSAFKALPLLLISFIGFLAIGLGNMGLFMLFIGHATIVPMLTIVANSVLGGSTSTVLSNDVSQLVPLASSTYNSATVSVMPSYWMAHMSFFLGYLLTNAATVYSLPVNSKVSKWLTDSRKTRAATIIVTTLGIWLGLATMRYLMTGGAETRNGILTAVVLLGGAGAAWYKLAEVCGARNSDLFSIVQQSVTTAKNDKPTTCVYKAKS